MSAVSLSPAALFLLRPLLSHDPVVFLNNPLLYVPPHSVGRKPNKTCRRQCNCSATFRLQWSFQWQFLNALPIFSSLKLLELLLSLWASKSPPGPVPKPGVPPEHSSPWLWLTQYRDWFSGRHVTASRLEVTLPGKSLLSHSLVLTINFQQITDMKSNGSVNCENHRKKINGTLLSLVSEAKV